MTVCIKRAFCILKPHPLFGFYIVAQQQNRHIFHSQPPLSLLCPLHHTFFLNVLSLSSNLLSACSLKNSLASFTMPLPTDHSFNCPRYMLWKDLEWLNTFFFNCPSLEVFDIACQCLRDQMARGQQPYTKMADCLCFSFGCQWGQKEQEPGII